jgi:EpsI family protein
MPENANLRFRRSKPFLVLTVALVLQGIAVRAVSRPEKVVAPPKLSGFPARVGPWVLAQEGIIDQETRDVLQADDLLSRVYARPGSRAGTSLFIASFLSQRNGKAPHSPRNCLPGEGWVQEKAEYLPLEVPGAGTVEVNHYVVANRDMRSDVLYWYQSHNRIVASEYRAKMFVVADAIRYNRTDTALVRVISPILNGQRDQALQANVEFVKDMFPILREFLPR